MLVSNQIGQSILTKGYPRSRQLLTAKVTFKPSKCRISQSTGQVSVRLVGVPPLLALDTNCAWPGKQMEPIKNHLPSGAVVPEPLS